MKIMLIVVGKLKEKFLIAGGNVTLRPMGVLCNVIINSEVNDEDNANRRRQA